MRLRTHNTYEIARVIDQNKAMRILRKSIEGKALLRRTLQYHSTIIQNQSMNIPNVQNEGLEDIPEISLNELIEALKEMKNNKTQFMTVLI